MQKEERPSWREVASDALSRLRQGRGRYQEKIWKDSVRRWMNQQTLVGGGGELDIWFQMIFLRAKSKER